MQKQIGTTLIELLVAIAIIGIISSVLVIQIRQTDSEVLHNVSERTAADLKQIRNLATSRVINEDTIYPPGGYGIYFDDSVTPSYYLLFADDGTTVGYQAAEDTLINKYKFASDDLEVYPTGLTDDQFYFTFLSEHTATTSVPVSGTEGVAIEIRDVNSGDKGVIRVFDVWADGYIWGNISLQYE